MPHRCFDWHEHVSAVEREYKAVLRAVEHFRQSLETCETIEEPEIRAGLKPGAANLEGTFIVRLFAAFEAALRSFDRARHRDSSREESASALIDSTGGKQARRIPFSVRSDAHGVRLVRNFWAHESD